ncbi:hypothetical protein IPM09_02875 [Candidatus Saccharibacteria bacterium]|nr:MAG: hypothetical protein IPM09_02875 [Candidatus Saccharibacteria bacterium]
MIWVIVGLLAIVVGVVLTTHGFTMHMLGSGGGDTFSDLGMGKWVMVLGVVIAATGAWLTLAHVG